MVILRGVPGALPDVLRRIPLQGISQYAQCHGVESVFFLLGCRQETPDLLQCQGVPDGEKIVRLRPRDLGPAPKDAGQV